MARSHVSPRNENRSQPGLYLFKTKSPFDQKQMFPTEKGTMDRPVGQIIITHLQRSEETEIGSRPGFHRPARAPHWRSRVMDGRSRALHVSHNALTRKDVPTFSH